MKILLEINGVHNFRKQNVITLEDSISQYDLMKCDKCGVSGKCRDLRIIEIDGRCKIKAERCTMSQAEFDKITLNTLYKSATKTDYSCPECGEELRYLDEYVEDGCDKVTHIDVICKCGLRKIMPLDTLKQ